MPEIQKKRINEILHTYWIGLRGGQAFPSESEINPSDIQDIWDACFLVKVDQNLEHPYHYVYLGRSLLEAYGGDDASEKEICEKLVYPSDASMVHIFKEVIDSEAPVDKEGEFTNSKNMLIKYRSSVLPLAGEDGSLGYLLGGMKWKAF